MNNFHQESVDKPITFCLHQMHVNTPEWVSLAHFLPTCLSRSTSVLCRWRWCDLQRDMATSTLLRSTAIHVGTNYSSTVLLLHSTAIHLGTNYSSTVLLLHSTAIHLGTNYSSTVLLLHSTAIHLATNYSSTVLLLHSTAIHLGTNYSNYCSTVALSYCSTQQQYT